MHIYDKASKKVNKLCKGRIILKYTIVGIVFGVMFPLTALLFELYLNKVGFSFDAIKHVHKVNPLLMMIDTAPIFLGLFAGIAGYNQSNSCIANQSLNQLVTYDELTGIYTRVTGKKMLKSYIDNLEEGMNISLFYIDLDNFKLINDTLGHLAGDRVLKATADKLEEFSKENGFAMRLGGDEFLIALINNYSKEELMNIAYMLNHYITIPVIIENKLIELSGSIGISSYPIDADCMDELLFASDAAMYDAKKSKSKCAYYDQKYKADYQSNLMVHAKILTAIDKSHFKVHYQPIIEKKSNTLVGLETVIQWHSQNTRYFYPRDFIRTDDNDDLIYKISLWSFDTICEDMNTLNSNGVSNIYFSVSFDSSKLNDLENAYQICKTASSYKLDQSLIKFELLKSRQIIDFKDRYQTLIDDSHPAGDYTTVYSEMSSLLLEDIESMNKLNILMKLKKEYSTICVKENNSHGYTKYVASNKLKDLSDKTFSSEDFSIYKILEPMSIEDILSDIKNKRYNVN